MFVWQRWDRAERQRLRPGADFQGWHHPGFTNSNEQTCLRFSQARDRRPGRQANLATSVPESIDGSLLSFENTSLWLPILQRIARAAAAGFLLLQDAVPDQAVNVSQRGVVR